MAGPLNRILVVEDDQAIRDVVVATLVDAGYSLASAANGQIGLDRCREFEPDVIMLDLAMPVLDGLGFLQKRSAHACNGSVVVMSAQYHQGALPADADYAAFVEKPFELGRLLDCVAGVIAAR